MVKIFDAGFSSQEANHEGVCVQELPPEERNRELAPTNTQLQRHETYKEFNIGACDSIAMR